MPFTVAYKFFSLVGFGFKTVSGIAVPDKKVKLKQGGQAGRD